MQTTLAEKVPTIPTWPNLDAGFWNATGSFLWIVPFFVVLFFLRKDIIDLFRALVVRVKSGAALKLGNMIEMSAIRATPDSTPIGSLISSDTDLSGKWRERREMTYNTHHNIFLAHRLFPSVANGQLYDVLIYLVPHRDRAGSLRDVKRVEYYFGDYWRNKVFNSEDSAKRFGIVVSSYGAGFVCVAKIFFHDDLRLPVETWRYIDFEMGPLGQG